MKNRFLRGRYPEQKYVEEDTCAFKTWHPVGLAPLRCWETVRAPEDNLVSVPSLLKVIINTITANCFLSNTFNLIKVSNEDIIAIICCYLQMFFFIILLPPWSEANWLSSPVPASALHSPQMVGLLWEGGDDVSAAAAEHSHNRARVKGSDRKRAEHGGVGLQAQGDNNLWNKLGGGQNSFWAWPGHWLEKQVTSKSLQLLKLDKCREGGNIQQQEHLIKR